MTTETVEPFTLCQETNWYDNIPEQGILCTTYACNGSLPRIVIISERNIWGYFKDNYGCAYKEATPLSKDEAIALVYQGAQHASQ